MEQRELKELLRRFKSGAIDEESVLDELKTLPFRDLGFAKLDTHRALRKGFPEVIYGAGKTTEQILGLCEAMAESGSRVLITRTTGEVYEAVHRRFDGARFNAEARAIVLTQEPVAVDGKGSVLVVSAGTTDIPVAEEAVVTLEVMGNRVEKGYDIGVAGLHRLQAVHEGLASARCIIVVAGMEGALPSVVAGLVSVPVIAVPTSVGYGVGFGGLSTLAAMLTSCSSGVGVVNIDNGFGAGYLASLINHL